VLALRERCIARFRRYRFPPENELARDAAQELVSNYGFKKLSVSDPFAAPVGSVLVYGTTRSVGHVELRTRTVSSATSVRRRHRAVLWSAFTRAVISRLPAHFNSIKRRWCKHFVRDGKLAFALASIRLAAYGTLVLLCCVNERSFDTSDVLELSRATLDEANRRLSEIPAIFVRRFTLKQVIWSKQLLGVYRTVALCVRKEEDLEKIAAWWEAMTKACDEFAGRLAKLSEEHPECGSEFFYDRVLDLRNKCQRLQEMHG